MIGHTHSQYEFEWHCRFGTDKFQTDRLWKAARAIISAHIDGYERLSHLLAADGKALASTPAHNGTKYTREEDMVSHVMAVMAIVCSNMPLSIFDNNMFQNYLQSLNSKHRTPHQMEQNQIIEVLMDFTMKRLSSILSNRGSELVRGFVSASTDFWTDSHMKEQFGALVVDLVAEQYMVKGLGRYMFMSRATAK